MDSGNVMRATKVDMKKSFERQNMSLLTYSLMAVPPGLSKPFLADLGESFKMHLRSFLLQMQQKGTKERDFFSFVRKSKYNPQVS